MSYANKSGVIEKIIEESPSLPSETKYRNWLEKLSLPELQDRLAQMMREGRVTPSSTSHRQKNNDYATA